MERVRYEGQRMEREGKRVDVVVLAAGKGRRMQSHLPKVLQPLGGRPLLAHVLEQARGLDPERLVVVVGYGAEQVREEFPEERVGRKVWWVVQEPLLGTGHAVQMAWPILAASPAAVVVVLYGDVPLVRERTLAQLVAASAEGSRLAVVTSTLTDPRGYGRVVRNEVGEVRAIVEERDADEQVRAINEVNTGLMAIPKERLGGWLGRLQRENAQGEFYLTDLVGFAVADGVPVATVAAAPEEAMGVNDKRDLARLERLVQRSQAEALLAAGVTLADPERIEVRGRLVCGRDVRIDVGCIFEGEVVLEDGVEIGAYSVLRDCTIGTGSRVEPFSHLNGARVGRGAVIGPFARVRPTTVLGDGVQVGNFVEVKNSTVGEGSKANHLSYLGDATVGARVNVGAGTITCNFDGAEKHRTVIEDEAFVGSDCQLVAPVRVGRGATIGAGTTLTRDAPPEALTVSRVPQRTVVGWKRPQKRERE
ncbi:MAG: bifunctional UDP-N-acetylglucosamine diphosphorylase/glucosamine-1-phosphate N-acetyltransferase GlmU [Hydrogenophilus sp.]|nr:bifunctional UDP-N-acetylglucosamine diphosphorylase/glucosamine-1-phosphate N-acetyltransferase GlmU [Hydrogenophilus sp.]